MSLTTVQVSISASKILGTPLAGGRVVFNLSAGDVDGTLVAPTTEEVDLDENGEATASLWPNAAGTQATTYNVHVFDSAGVRLYTGTAYLPETDCNLHDALQLSPPSRADDAAAAVSAARGYRDEAATSAGTATTQAGIATTQAGIATTKAGEASDSADLAQSWATKTDGEVVTGQGYGAKKYAEDAASEAASAATERAASEVAADLAFTNANAYADTTAGLAATASGSQFQVAGTNESVRYLDNAGVALELVRFPTSAGITRSMNQPFRREDYGPSKFFTIKDVLTATGLTIDSTANRLTIGATTGTMTLVSSNSLSLRFTPGENIVIWFEAVTGTPTTFTYRFLTSGGAGIGTATALGRFGVYYFVEVQVPATAANLTLTISNTAGSSIVITRPAVAWQKSTPKDGNPEPGTTALRSLMAQTAYEEQGNLWSTSSVGKVSGAGTAPTLNGDGTITMPPDAVQYARSDLAVTEGDVHTWLVKIATANLDLKYVYIRYNGSPSVELMRLENYGNGWWGKAGHTVGSITSGVGTTSYVRVEVENTTSSYYTAAAVTISAIYLIEGSSFPNQLPASASAAGSYDKTEVVVQQAADTINVFTPGSNPATSKYVRWALNQYVTTDTGAVGSGWTMKLLHECTRTGDDSFSVGNQLTDSGSEHWLAVRENGKQHMGGKTHGNQVAGTNLGSCTITIASPAVVTLASHGLAAGDRVVFTTSGALPTGITRGVVYYVISAGLTANDFQFSTTSGGSAVNTSGTQSGTHTLRKRGERLMLDGAKKAIDGATSYRGQKVEFFQKSQLLDTSDGVTPRFDVITTALFSAEGLRLRHRIAALAAIPLSSAYLAMLSLSRWINNVSANGEQFSNAYWSPDYTEATTAVQSDVENTAKRYVISGAQGITLDAQVTEGWSVSSRESFVQRATNSVKVYFSPVGINQSATATVYTTTNGEVIEMETLIRVNTAN